MTPLLEYLASLSASPAADVGNALLEVGGSFFISLSIRRLLIDKAVKGISVPHFVFYSLWGWYNVFFYPIMGLWFSFYGGLLVLVANTVWITLAAYYLWLRPRWDFAGWAYAIAQRGLRLFHWCNWPNCGCAKHFGVSGPLTSCLLDRAAGECPHGYEDWDRCPDCCH